MLKISQEHGIDLSLVTGTGNEGRITRKDLLKIVESGEIPVAKVQQEAVAQQHPRSEHLHQLLHRNQLSL